MKFSEIQYVRPDFPKLAQGIKKFMSDFSMAKTYADARALYMHLCKELDDMGMMVTVAHIRSTLDTRDEFYQNEMTYFFEEDPKLELILKDANALLLASPFKADFEKEFGPDFIKGMEAQQKLADESVVEEKIEESKLVQEYNATVASCSTTFRGEECNFYGLLKHMLSTDREERKDAFLAWANLYESVSEKLDGYYDRLVLLRKTMAKKLGFKNYVEMAYLLNGHYYYGADEVASFRKQVVDVIVPLAAKLYEEQKKRLGVDSLRYYDEQLCYPDGNASPIGDKDYLVKSAHEMYRAISKETGEFFDLMVERELFDLETKPGKQLGGYCTFIPVYNAPFIFSNFNGSSADVDVLTHEAGHAFQAFTSAKFVPLSSLIWSTSEISEIHSMSMEHFAYPYMDKFFGDKADKYRYAHLSESVKCMPYLCLVDHFQHEVFNHDYTAKERRACWKRLEKIYLPWRDYDGNAFLEEGGFWMQKPHIFASPFYYVDYALAQTGAFEYYARMKENRAEAWKDYYRLCTVGGSKSYFETLKVGNLSNPFEQGTVEKVVKPVREELLK